MYAHTADVIKKHPRVNFEQILDEDIEINLGDENGQFSKLNVEK